MARTTILIQDGLLLEVKRVAQSQGTTITEVINSALQAYVGAQPHAGLPSFTGIGRSKGPVGAKLGRKAKRLAAHIIDPFEGSSRTGKR
jgi:hypothetical protein